MKHLIKTRRIITSRLFVLLLFLGSDSFAQDASIFTKDGHFYDLYSMSLSPDGKILATVDKWYTCILWDVSTGQQFQTIKEIKAVAFAGSNESMCVVTEENEVRVISLTGQVLKTISQNKILNTNREQTNFYPESGIYITGTSVYDINKGIIFNAPAVSKYNNPVPAYSPALRQLAISSRKGDSIYVYDVPGNKMLFSLRTESQDNNYASASYSRDGQLLSMATTGIFKVFDMNTKKAILTFQDNDPHGYIVKSATISPDGKKVIYWTHSDEKKKELVSLIDIRSGTRIWTKEFEDMMPWEAPYTRFSDDGKKLILGSHKKLLNISAEDGTVQSSFVSYAVNGFYGFYSTNNKNRLIGVMSSDTVKVFFWNIPTGQMENIASFDRGNSVVPLDEIKPFPDGKKLVGISSGKLIEVDSAGRLLYSYPAYPAQTYPSSIDVSYTGKYVMRTFWSEKCQGSFEVYDCTTRKKVFSKACVARDVAFAKTQNIIAVLEGASSEFVRFYELPTGKLLQQVKVQAGARDLIYAPNDQYVSVITEGESSMNPNDDKTTIIHVKNKTVDNYAPPSGPDYKTLSRRYGFSADGRYMIFENSGYIIYFDLHQKAYTKTIPLKKLMGSEYSSFSFSDDGRYIFTGGRHATITIFDTENKKVIARLYPDIRRKDWAVVTPDGRFDGNSGALGSMYHAKGNAIVPLSAMYEKFYTPRLLPRLLAGETFDPVTVDVNDLKKTPVVTMEFKEGSRNLEVDDDIKTISSKSANATITVTASCPQDAVSEIRLYQNGKLIETTRNLEVDDDDNSNKTLTRNFQVSLLNGNNNFRAIALNSQRSESKPLELIVQYATDKTVPGSNTAAAQLHIVVIGINTYKNAKYNLNYAKPDAAAFREAIETGSTGIFSRVNTHYITDTDASKAGISNALDKVKLSAQPQDLFIFYYAGHGVVNDKKEFYLVPSDVTQLYGNDEGLAQNGLSAAQLQKFSKEIRAQKQLYILDACQSAGALDNIVAARGAAEEKAIAQLARSTGTHWLTASGSTQFASEFAQLGHGSFTYCLLEAFKGKADNGDKKVTVKELDAYLQVRVPEITQQYKGSAQYPASFGYGNDFPLLIVK